MIYGFSGILLKLISLITFPIFAHYFPPSAYGLIGVLTSLSLVLMTLSGVGMEAAAFRFFFDKEDINYKYSIFTTWFFGRLVLTFVAISIVYLFLRKWLIVHYLDSDQAHLLLVIVLATLPFSIIPSIINIWLVINKKAFYSLLFSVLLTILSAGLSLLFVFAFKLQVVGFFLGQAVAYTVASIFGYFLFRSRKKSFRFDFTLLKSMIRYGLKVIPATLSNNFLLFFATLIILTITSQHLLGIFQVGYTIATVILFFTAGFSQAFIPFSLSLKDEEFNYFCKWSLDIYVSLMSFICFSIGILYHEIIALLFGIKYSGSIEVAGILTFSNFILSIGTIASISFVKTKKVGLYGIIVFSGNLIHLLLLYILTTNFGLQGASVSFLIISLLVVSTMFYFSNNILQIPFQLVKNLLILLFFLAFYYFIASIQVPYISDFLSKILFIVLGGIIISLINYTNIKKGLNLFKQFKKFKEKLSQS